MNINRVLVPVDGSEYSMKAAKYAIDFVQKFKCEVVVLHCHKAFPLYLGEPHFQNIVNKTIEDATEMVGVYDALFDEYGIDHKILLLEEPPGKTIAETAVHEKADMIIMGSRGLSDLSGLILGSTAHKVLHLSSCPVLIIK